MLYILSQKLQTQIKMLLHRMQTPITSPSPLVVYIYSQIHKTQLVEREMSITATVVKPGGGARRLSLTTNLVLCTFNR